MTPRAGVEIDRDDHGVPHVRAASLADAWWGLGYCHALDRLLQILLMRILGRGTASEHLEATEDALRLDRFFRRMGWAVTADPDPLAGIDGAAAEAGRAYVAGINHRLFAERRGRAPWELRLLGYRPDPWSVADTLLLMRMAGYLTLAQGQGEIERLLVEMVQAGIARERLEELFPGLLDGLDEDLVRRVRLEERLVTAALTWGIAAPRPLASNGSIVAGTRTASGRPVLVNDVDLEAALPNVWYEVVIEADGRYAAGATMPGIPGVLIGRNADVAWGATYSFMDAVDSWIEDCRDGCYRRAAEWVPFRVRRETIRRKGRRPVEVTFHENEHGVLDGEPDGYRLATRWALAEAGAASVERAFRLFAARAAAEALEQLGGIELSFNWLAADRGGHIGFQMSGLCPRRREGARGLVPLPGWDPANDWQGWVAPADLPRAFDPPEGFFANANEDVNARGRVPVITVAMGPYRAERLRDLLAGMGDHLTAEQVAARHSDVLSLQARRFLEVLRPLLPDSEQGRILRDWDLRYDPDSKGAWLFEQFYRELLREVFGRSGLGPRVAGFLLGETGIVVDFYGCFDRVLLAPRSEWLGGEEREAVWRRVASRSLAVGPRPWGEAQQLRIRHLLFGGRLPLWLGFDRGPITVRGGRATVQQGQLYRSVGRETSFLPSFRMVADLGEPGLRTSLAGGPSDRRFSRLYCLDLAGWLAGRYKKIVPRASEGGPVV